MPNFYTVTYSNTVPNMENVMFEPPKTRILRSILKYSTRHTEKVFGC